MYVLMQVSIAPGFIHNHYGRIMLMFNGSTVQAKVKVTVNVKGHMNF